MALQSTRDADLLGSRHPWIDDRTLTHHSTIRTPERHETCKKPVLQDHDTCGLMIRHKEALKFSHCTGITSQPAGQKEPKMLLLDTKHCYGLGHNELQDHLAKPEISTGNVTSLIPAEAPLYPPEVEGLKSPRSKPPHRADWSDNYEACTPLFHASRSYVSANMLHGITETLSFMSDPTFLKPQEFAKSTKTLQNQEQVLDDTLHALFGASRNKRAYIIEVMDDTGLKRYEFAPEYAELLVQAMHLITNLLNRYWKVARFTKVFSFGRSSNYDMEFSKLVYRSWATHLVLRSVRNRLLARIQVAMEAVEECSHSTSYVLNTIRLTITTDQVPTQGQSPKAEDLCWEFQLQQDRSTILLRTVAATTCALLSELWGRQQDWDYTCHLSIHKPSTNCASTAAPLPVQAPVELLGGSYQVTDTTSTGLSGTRQWQKEPAPPENNVKGTDKRLLKGSKVGGEGVPVAKKEPRSGSPQERQALLLQDRCASEDMNLRSHHSETTTLPAIRKTEERAPLPEHLEWQKDWDYICSLDKNCVSSATSLLAQAPVKTLDNTPWMDTLSTGLSGKQQQQEEPAPPEDDVNNKRSSKGSKVGKAEVPVAKERMSRIPLIVQAKM